MVKGFTYMATEENLTLGDGYMMQYTDDRSQNCTFKIYITLFTNMNVTPIYLIKKRNWQNGWQFLQHFLITNEEQLASLTRDHFLSIFIKENSYREGENLS